jgi:putative DNA primase/helicase
LHDLAKGDLNPTDMGNASRFVSDHKTRIRYCYPWNKWLVWNGIRWESDVSGSVTLLGKTTVRRIYGEAEVVADEKERVALAEWAMKSEAQARVMAMVELAKCEVSVQPTALDTDAWLLNTENGLLSLKTGELREHDSAKMCTKLAPVIADPSAECPAFDAFLTTILPDLEVRRFLQRYLGSALTGAIRDHVFAIFWGSGGNGKTTLLEAVRYVMGDYAKQIPTDLLMEKQNDAHPTERTTLLGLRLAIASETEKGKSLAEALVKSLTGGERIPARFMHGDWFEFEPTHKLILCTNHRPNIKGTDEGIWRRIHLVPFTVTIPKEDRDPHLLEKLREEGAGILRWLVEGCLSWQEQGLAAPTAVLDATAAYRSQSDVVGHFLSEKCELKRTAMVSAADLYRTYETWCETNGERPASKKAFGLEMGERNFERGTDGSRMKMRVYVGLELRKEDDDGEPVDWRN